MKRAISIPTLRSKKYVLLPFRDKWKNSIDNPEDRGSWIIWGNSGNGKSRFVMQLAEYLTNFGKVIYNSMEEGTSYSFAKNVKDAGITTDKILVVNESLKELSVRLSSSRSPRIIIIDSIQHAGFNKTDYTKFKRSHHNCLLIFISHADGKKPEGRTANFIRYDSAVKIYVEGYKAMVTSRYGGNEDFIIWPEGAAKYWGTTNSKTTDNDN